MPSPFPGMDPYLEDPAFWPDFHPTFINYWREAIADLLPENYEARIGERVVWEEMLEDWPRGNGPDLLIHQSSGDSAIHSFGGGGPTLEPIMIPLLVYEGPWQSYIEIFHRPERTLVAALQLLTPLNKSGSGRAEYLANRNALVLREVHLVELDLLLGGHRIPLKSPLPPGHFYAFISRGDRRPDCDVYTWTLRQPLPTLPIPLMAPDSDIWIDLAAVFSTAYDRGRYLRSLAYEKPQPVSLNAEDQGWVREQLAAIKVR